MTDDETQGRDTQGPETQGHESKYQQRDATSLRVLGIFFGLLGAIVLIGTFFALSRIHAAVVNAVSGLVLAGVGIGMYSLADRMERRERG